MFKLTRPSAETKTSSWLLTINPQQSNDVDNQQQLSTIVTPILENFDQYLQFTKGDSNCDVSSVITNPKLEVVLEEGSKFHRLHLHCLVTVTTPEDRSLMVNLAKLRSDLGRGFGYVPFVNCKYVADRSIDLRRYLLKDQR